MRISLRCLQEAHPLRHQSTSFIGLGRMGYEMAFNLFSKRHKETQGATFVVCDALATASQKFYSDFGSQFGFDRIRVVNTPEEYVHQFRSVQFSNS